MALVGTGLFLFHDFLRPCTKDNGGQHLGSWSKCFPETCGERSTARSRGSATAVAMRRIPGSGLMRANDSAHGAPAAVPSSGPRAEHANRSARMRSCAQPRSGATPPIAHLLARHGVAARTRRRELRVRSCRGRGGRLCARGAPSPHWLARQDLLEDNLLTGELDRLLFWEQVCRWRGLLGRGF